MRGLLGICGVFVILFSSCGWGNAAAEKRVALVIGNASYKHASSLPNARRDAELIASTLQSTGVDVSLVIDAEKEALTSALQVFGGQADEADWAVVYYAGHAIEVAGENYLIPIDAQISKSRDVGLHTINLKQVLQSTEGAKLLSLVFLDACRDNPFAAVMQGRDRSTSVGRGLAKVEPEGATAVVYAAKSGTTAQDGSGSNGPFATALAKELTTPGLEINMLFRRVRQDVLETTGNEQEPFVYGSLPPTEFFFVDTPSSGTESASLKALSKPATELEKPKSASPQILSGLNVAPLDEESRKAFGYPSDVEGVLIADVTPEFQQRFGAALLKGEIIQSVKTDDVKTPNEFLDRLSDSQSRSERKVLLKILSPNSQQRFEILRGL